MQAIAAVKNVASKKYQVLVMTISDKLGEKTSLFKFCPGPDTFLTPSQEERLKCHLCSNKMGYGRYVD